jgi:intracellular sulfur oxidation DsrE/DsrF family protein
MRFNRRTFTAACALVIATGASAMAANVKIHRVSIQVDQNDPAVMNLALNNASNIMETFKEKGEEVEIEVVTYGPGLNMLREDTSPVKDRLKQIAELSFPSKIRFSACNVTKRGMEKREGHAIPIVAEASLVPSGAVRLMELQESGWSYLKP